MKKRKSAFRFRTGFFFGLGFTFAAYLTMWFMIGAGDFLLMLFKVIMTGLGFAPGVFK
jgi:hypothetical protein